VWQFYEWKKRLRSAKAEPFVAVEVVASEAVRAIAYEEFDPPGDRWRPPVKSHQLIFWEKHPQNALATRSTVLRFQNRSQMRLP